MSNNLPEYGYAHKGGENDDAYYSAYVITDDCTQTIARECPISAALAAIHAHADVNDHDRYIIRGWADYVYQNGIALCELKQFTESQPKP